MEQLPYIDKHDISIGADRAETWSALLRVMCRDPNDPSTVRTDFFALDDAAPPKRLALKGRHPFSVYQLVFELADEGPQRTRLRALTWAAFPGLSGKAYRALVIGTGGHRLAVRLMLHRVAAAARPPTGSVATAGLSWGAEPAERTASLPCDALTPSAGTRADRAISIDAPPAIVFAWLCQLRVAPYSYDVLDNFGRRSPREQNPELLRLEVGQRFMAVFTLQSFVDGEQITLRTKGVAVTYAVRSQGAGSRLHVRVLFELPWLVGRVGALGDVVMMRKQLLTLKSLAEGEAANAGRH
jgi:hypothetical protein